MTLSLRHEVLQLALRDPFVIARSEPGGGRSITTMIVELTDDRFPGLVGLGEGYPDRFYGETPETMIAVWPLLLEAAGQPEPTAAGVRAASQRLQAVIRWNGAAKCALDVALHDLVGKISGRPVRDLLGLTGPIPPTDFTLGLDEPAIVADESCVTVDDLDALAGLVAGVNVKLAKCGGVGPAARMLARARELGFRTFLGCMEETSVGIAASAAVASLAEWVDLDGCLLLAADPFEGLELDREHRWRLGSAPGLGVRRRA